MATNPPDSWFLAGRKKGPSKNAVHSTPPQQCSDCANPTRDGRWRLCLSVYISSRYRQYFTRIATLAVHCVTDDLQLQYVCISAAGKVFRCTYNYTANMPTLLQPNHCANRVPLRACSYLKITTWRTNSAFFSLSIGKVGSYRPLLVHPGILFAALISIRLSDTLVARGNLVGGHDARGAGCCMPQRHAVLRILYELSRALSLFHSHIHMLHVELNRPSSSLAKKRRASSPRCTGQKVMESLAILSQVLYGVHKSNCPRQGYKGKVHARSLRPARFLFVRAPYSVTKRGRRRKRR